jgi:alcohol dehydrogenase
VKPLQLHLPRKLVFGDHCLNDFINYFLSLPYNRVYILADPGVRRALETLSCAFEMEGLEVFIRTTISSEPTVGTFLSVLKEAEENRIDSVIGIGGGSVLDVSKLLAAMYLSGQKLDSVFGSDKILGRKLFLACLPTTAGTGSEVSPNCILLDEDVHLKKGIISPFLLPDVTYIDPILTHTCPPGITASTGVDALTHCIEAYANKNANSITDLYALEGIRLIFGQLAVAFENGNNSKARRDVSLGSMYGGLCLGPVNTAAVHALAYPLGSKYSIPHGVSNALLLSQVLDYNLSEGISRYAAIARSIGVDSERSEQATAIEGVRRIKELCCKLGIPDKLTAFNVPVDDVPDLARSAMSVQRLLQNNLREVTQEEAEEIYYKLF